jgi:hypothetical protein
MDEDAGNTGQSTSSHQGEIQQEENTPTPNKRHRKFIKRQKWRRKKKNLEKTRQQESDTKLIPTQIVNLSSHELTPTQIRVLNKGLGFCPTPTSLNKIDFHTDVLRFIRNLRIQHYQFLKSKEEPTTTPTTTIPTTRFKLPSQWTPGTNINHNLDLFCNIIENELLSLFDNKKKISQNITPEERIALQELSTNRDIIIKPAEKGGAIVIMNTVDYINEANKQLRDFQTYRRLTRDITPDRQKRHQWVPKNLHVKQVDNRRGI